MFKSVSEPKIALNNLHILNHYYVLHYIQIALVCLIAMATATPLPEAKPEAKPGVFATPLVSAAYSAPLVASPLAYTAGYAPYYSGYASAPYVASPYAAYTSYSSYPALRYTAGAPVIF